MTDMLSRLPELLEERREFAPLERKRKNASDPVLDDEGDETVSLANTLRFYGVAEYMLENDIASFKEKLAESAMLQRQLFERFEVGERIDHSYVATLSFHELFDGLAAGDFDEAKKLASQMGGHGTIEKEQDNPFNHAFGYALKALVLNDAEQMEKRLVTFHSECEKMGNANFLGYAEMFDAILAGDVETANAALEKIIVGHKKECNDPGDFYCTDDELLCIWGIGMVNLARHRGLAVKAIPPLIPADLLIEVSE